MHKPIYLDYMATTPLDKRVADKMQAYLAQGGIFGNSASPHIYGYAAKEAIENTRAYVANMINGDPKGIIWTSGATEGNNLAICGAASFYKRQGKHIITCKTEHKSVLDPCKYLENLDFKVTYLTPNQDGLIPLCELTQAIQPDTILVSIMHVNNEIGVIQDIDAIGKITASRGILFHVDAAQSIGKLPIDIQKSKIDLLSFSAHKVYGPKGIGALYIRQFPKLHLVPQIRGGGQESGIRSGTLATHQIVGLGEALTIANQEMIEENKRILKLRERLWQGIKNLGNSYINGSITKRIAGNLNISFDGIGSTILLIDALKDLAVSSASSCTKAFFSASHVLKAIGIDTKLAHNTIRISIGRFTTDAEIDFAINHINEVVTKLRNN